MGDVGGIKSTLFSFGSIASLILNRKLLYSSIISNPNYIFILNFRRESIKFIEALVKRKMITSKKGNVKM